jgi:hypothetical protein
MLRLPPRFATVILFFAPLFRHRSWRHAEVLLLGAILAPGQRTVTSILRIGGLSRERRFVNYHRVLNRAAWAARAASRRLLALRLTAVLPSGPVLLGIDDTIERRRGKRIAARGIYRDPVRSSDAHFVKASGLRWLSLMLLAPVPWAGRVWALPFLTVLAPSERYARQRGRRHKTLTDWARQMVLQARRWLPGRALVLIADSGFAALDLLTVLTRHGVTCITRLRLDAALHAPAASGRAASEERTPPPHPGRGVGKPAHALAAPDRPGLVWRGRPGGRNLFRDRRVVHPGLPPLPIRRVLLRDPRRRFDPQALLCTDPARDPLRILTWFVRRWQVEVTFREVREHLGVETQRQWSDKAIARTTPCLLALFSVIVLLAARLPPRARLTATAAAWYHKRRPSFADTLAAVRRHIWREQGLLTSRRHPHRQKLRPALREGIVHALCHAA